MRPPLSRIPLLPVAIGMASGIVFAFLSPDFAIAGCIIAAILGGVLIRRGEWWMAIVALSVIPGASTTLLHDSNVDTTLSGEWEGEVIEVAQSDRASTLDVNIYSCYDGKKRIGISPFNIRIYVPSPDSTYIPGQYIRFGATFTTPTDDIDLPYQIPERVRLRDLDLAYTVLITQENISTCGHCGWRTSVASLRTRLTDILLRSSLQSRTKEFLAAAIFGYKHLLAPDTLEEYERGGISHVLAISGLHIGILVWLFTLLLFPVRLLSRRIFSILIIVLIWMYALLNGFAPSVTRAVIMVSMILAGNMLQRSPTPFNSLLLAFIVILLVSPLSLFSIGFQMSFCAVASILLFTPHLNRVSPRHRIAYFFGSTLSATLAATLSVGIISAYYFHSFPLLFLLSNLVLAILLPLILSSGVGIILLSLLGVPTGWIANIADALYNLNALYLKALSHCSFTSLTDLYFPAWIIILWIAGLITLKLSFITQRKVYGYCTAILLLSSVIIILLPNQRADYDTYSRIYFQRQKTVTTIIVERPDTPLSKKIEILTSASPHTREALLNDFKERNREWIIRDRISDIRISDSDTLSADNVRLTMIHRGKKAAHLDGKFTHAVVCRGFTGTLTGIRDSLAVDTFILSYDIHPKVFKRLKAEAEEYGMSYISLKDSTYSIVTVP